jgi:4-nitrophenyl phosphatase
MVLATNNSSSTVDQYISKLKRMGVHVNPEEILTSAQATSSYLYKIAPKRSRVFVIGGDGITNAIRDHEFVLTEDDPDYVVIGIDKKITWEKLNTAVMNIRAGAKFIGTNPDTTYPTENGIGVGNGAILAAVKAATGISPLVIGKPETPIYEQALQRLKSNSSDTLMIGDRLDTDILGAQRAGITTLLVLTGVTTLEMSKASVVQPDLVLTGLPDITSGLLAV